MSAKLLQKIKKKRAEIEGTMETIVSLQETVKQEQRYLQALEDAYSMLEKDSAESGAEPRHDVVLKQGTDLARVREAILAVGHPLHIKLIMERMGRGNDPKFQASLVGSLGQYVRKKKVFNRPEPNVFGLIELTDLAELNRATASLKPGVVYLGKH